MTLSACTCINPAHARLWLCNHCIKALDDNERQQIVGRDSLPCSMCNQPVVFEFTVASDIWNRIVRAKGIDEYLCLWCFARLAGDERIPVGVNVHAGKVFSQWCVDDVPGTYPGDVTRKQLLDDNERLRQVILAADVCGEIGVPCPWCSVRSYDGNIEAVHAASCPWLTLQTGGPPAMRMAITIDYVAELETVNAQYILTIAQLKKERAEAVERVRELEVALWKAQQYICRECCTMTHYLVCIEAMKALTPK